MFANALQANRQEISLSWPIRVSSPYSHSSAWQRGFIGSMPCKPLSRTSRSCFLSMTKVVVRAVAPLSATIMQRMLGEKGKGGERGRTNRSLYVDAAWLNGGHSPGGCPSITYENTCLCENVGKRPQSIKTSFEATTLLKQNLEDKREEQSSRQSEYREPNEPADKEVIFFLLRCSRSSWRCIMMMVTVLDEWRPCASNAKLKKKKEILTTKQNNKNHLNNNLQTNTNLKTGSFPYFFAGSCLGRSQTERSSVSWTRCQIRFCRIHRVGYTSRQPCLVLVTHCHLLPSGRECRLRNGTKSCS